MDIIDNIIKNNVSITGVIDNCMDDEYVYRHLVISKEELSYITNQECSLDRLCSKYSIDFVSVIEEGDLDFIHISKECNKNSIKSKGLININRGYIPDLGVGIYVVDSDDLVGLDNVKAYVSEHMDGLTLLLVKGTYNGVYKRCIYGEGREGYIVLNDDVPYSALSLSVVDIDDFLLYY